MNHCAKFANLDFNADCPEMILSYQAEQSKEIKGSGEIWQDEKGTIRFKIYLTGESLDLLVIHLDKTKVAGKLLNHNDYFNLTAYDYTGPIWSANSIYPDTRKGPNGGMAVGKIYQLKKHYVLSSELQKSCVTVRFLGKTNFPANLATQTETRVGERLVSSSGSMNAAEATIDDSIFKIGIEGKHTVASLCLTGPIDPTFIASNIEAALQFATGRELTRLTVESSEKNIINSTLCSAKTTGPKGYIQSPLNVNTFDTNGHFWQLFSDYYRHVSSNESLKNNPLSNHISMAIESSVATMEAAVLALAVGVEGIAKHTLKAEAKTQNNELLEEIELVSKAISNLTISETTKKRIQGSINALKNVRTTDLLKNFIENSSLSKGTYEAWNTLRNKVAHGSGLQYEDIELNLQFRDKVIALMYALVFDAIGYKGTFVNYGLVGWPESTWPIQK